MVGALVVRVMLTGKWSEPVGMCTTAKLKMDGMRGKEQSPRSITDCPCVDKNVKEPSGSSADWCIGDGVEGTATT